MTMIIWVLITYSIDLNSNIHLFLHIVLVREHHANEKKGGSRNNVYFLQVPHGRQYSNNYSLFSKRINLGGIIFEHISLVWYAVQAHQSQIIYFFQNYGFHQILLAITFLGNSLILIKYSLMVIKQEKSQIQSFCLRK